MKFKMCNSGMNSKPVDKKQMGSKNTKSFPDLNKDGKVSRADVLVGRGVIPAKKMAMGTKKAKSFPDLNKDGKITQADILKGRGVIKKSGANSMKVDEKMCGSKGMKYAEGSKGIKFKKKPMIKRADGSYSQRGLWDNIRANKGSGKKPTSEMLKQEKKIKAGK